MNQIYDSPEAWVDRALDDTLKNALQRDVTFLVAESGLGKSVACHRLLTARVNNGSFGLILPHGTINAAASVEQAVLNELRRLHPHLSLSGPSAFEFCSPDNPILLLIEDINRSGQEAPRLIEKIANWSSISGQKNVRDASPSPWRLICPVWPQSLTAVREQAMNCVSQLCVMAEGFSEEEGTNAVLARGHLVGYSISRLHAQETASALGYDPLLIALHDPGTEAESNSTIAKYIEHSLERATADDYSHTGADYSQVILSLATEMLLRRKIELSWLEVKRWFDTHEEFSALLAQIGRKRELLRLEGRSTEQRLVFRHDRVREWLLAEAVTELHQTGCLCNELAAEPYFADVLGAALARSTALDDMLECVAPVNPLALFHAFRLTSQMDEKRQHAILQRITAWLDSPDMPGHANDHLRWEALAVLARTDSAIVPTLVHKFPDRTYDGLLARFRNGDVSGGIELCRILDPGAGATWRDMQIEHARQRYGAKLVEDVAKALRQVGLENGIRVGALRLAGHLAHHMLAEAIEACWGNDRERITNLAEYLWAFAECCGNDPARYLGPVCDAWASLPEKADQKGLSSPRDILAAYSLRFAFQKWPPVSAINYFIDRAQKEDLRVPIRYMLHEIDHPTAVLFVAGELAKIQQRLDGTNSFSPFFFSTVEDWRRAQKNGHPMSRASRDALLALWQHSGTDSFLRQVSLSLWTATTCTEDMAALQAIAPSDDLFEQALAQRLKRGDQSAIPELIKRLDMEQTDLWWQYGLHIWSPELTNALDAHLARRADWTKAHSYNTTIDWITSQLIMCLPSAEAERLLLKHWSHLRFTPPFIQPRVHTDFTDAARGGLQGQQAFCSLNLRKVELGQIHGFNGINAIRQCFDDDVPFCHQCGQRSCEDGVIHLQNLPRLGQQNISGHEHMPFVRTLVQHIDDTGLCAFRRLTVKPHLFSNTVSREEPYAPAL